MRLQSIALALDGEGVGEEGVVWSEGGWGRREWCGVRGGGGGGSGLE